jgi:hypothetical protein
LRSARSPGQAKNYSKLKVFSNVEKETVQRIYIGKRNVIKGEETWPSSPAKI